MHTSVNSSCHTDVTYDDSWSQLQVNRELAVHMAGLEPSTPAEIPTHLHALQSTSHHRTL